MRRRFDVPSHDVAPDGGEDGMPGHSRGLLRQLYVQVLIAIVIGGALGGFRPEFAATLQPIADAFIKLIKMLLAPIIFGTLVVGMARMGSIREVGRIGVKALIYFEVVSTLALVIGLVVINLVRPGEGMNIDANGLDGSAVAGYARSASESGGLVGFLGGNESYPDLFQPYGGFPDSVTVDDGYIVMPDLPGIGFEGKTELIAVMRALAE